MPNLVTSINISDQEVRMKEALKISENMQLESISKFKTVKNQQIPIHINEEPTEN